MELGNRLKELRKSQNINQDELAEKLFVTYGIFWQNRRMLFSGPGIYFDMCVL